MYEGRFANDKPVGDWKRYHDNGKLQATIAYSEKSDSAFATLFDLTGTKIAEGAYINQVKVGTWKYFTGGKLVSEDQFSDGVKNGVSRRFYSSGKVLEYSELKAGKKHGQYVAYFENGQPYLEVAWANDQREGACRSYFENGKTELEAAYLAGQRHGEWKYFNDKGELLFTLKYQNGELLNPNVLDSVQNQKLNQMDQNKGKIVDPEQFIQNPEEYLRRTR
jgi:antitoxin component YwqK of YwqJK toxin-antitoxin module